MNPKDEYDYNITDININSFNNKADKGDDDFEDWLVTAPLISTDDTYQGTYDSSTTITLNSDYANKSIKYINTQSLKYSMPIDMLYKWYPVQMKELDNDDEVPF
tara:strand:+ start:8922 stop:9233 length:312 start_codon:yes stop_codon:yes gene_type:complete